MLQRTIQFSIEKKTFQHRTERLLQPMTRYKNGNNLKGNNFKATTRKQHELTIVTYLHSIHTLPIIIYTSKIRKHFPKTPYEKTAHFPDQIIEWITLYHIEKNYVDKKKTFQPVLSLDSRWRCVTETAIAFGRGNTRLYYETLPVLSFQLAHYITLYSSCHFYVIEYFFSSRSFSLALYNGRRWGRPSVAANRADVFVGRSSDSTDFLWIFFGMCVTEVLRNPRLPWRVSSLNLKARFGLVKMLNCPRDVLRRRA